MIWSSVSTMRFIQLVACESRNSYPNFSIFRIALFENKILNSRLRMPGGDQKEKI